MNTTDNTTTQAPGWIVSLGIFSELYYPPIIVVTGTVGNILMFMLMNLEEFRLTPSSIYMRGISITDSIYLISRVGQSFLLNFLPWLLTGKFETPFCMEYYILFTFGQAASLLLLVAMSFDRALAILCPMKVLKRNAMKKAKIQAIIAAMLAFVYSLCFNLSRTHIPHLRKEGWSCPYYFNPPYDVIITHIESALGYSCLLLMIFVNILIIITILKSRRHRKEMQGIQNADNDNHMLIMLLTISCCYLVAYLLPRMKNAYYFANEAKTIEENHISNAISIITVMIEHGNFALNFYFYALPLSKFRNALLILLKLRERPGKECSTSFTSSNPSRGS